MSSNTQRDLEAYRAQETEKAFMQKVIDAARYMGWLVYHTYESRWSQEGFPDLVMGRSVMPKTAQAAGATPARLIFAELKAEKGKLTKRRLISKKRGLRWAAGQEEWISLLSLIPGIECYVWRPSDWETIEKTLR